jgi:nucleoside-diphosphate-sugar epimerase
MQNKAVIIGSTGLIGSYLLEYLLNSEQYTQVIAFVRTPLSSKNNKLTYIETDFNHLDQIASHINGSCLFICIGSTMAKAGSKEAFLKVDYDIPVNVAHIAQKNGVAYCVVVSSLGANANSNNFYLLF